MVRVKHDDARRAKMFAGVRHDTDDETRNNMLSTARLRMGTKDTGARCGGEVRLASYSTTDTG